MATPFKDPRTGIFYFRRVVPCQQLRSARAMVDDFLSEQSDEQLQGVAQKLAALEFGAFQYAESLTDDATGARYDFGSLPNP